VGPQGGNGRVKLGWTARYYGSRRHAFLPRHARPKRLRRRLWERTTLLIRLSNQPRVVSPSSMHPECGRPPRPRMDIRHRWIHLPSSRRCQSKLVVVYSHSFTSSTIETSH
jgi:hypothetical protein